MYNESGVRCVEAEDQEDEGEQLAVSKKMGLVEASQEHASALDAEEGCRAVRDSHNESALEEEFLESDCGGIFVASPDHTVAREAGNHSFEMGR